VFGVRNFAVHVRVSTIDTMPSGSRVKVVESRVLHRSILPQNQRGVK
jgi:hypothetical protein